MLAAGGFSGMINAGMNINYLIHNTIWIPGHFREIPLREIAELLLQRSRYPRLSRL
jgi:heme/copper-type cytochrome/quinol oxidase subunit 1